MTKSRKPNTECCEGCWKWNQFKDECHVYWDYKKVCTQKEDAPGQEII